MQTPGTTQRQKEETDFTKLHKQRLVVFRKEDSWTDETNINPHQNDGKQKVWRIKEARDPKLPAHLSNMAAVLLWLGHVWLHLARMNAEVYRSILCSHSAKTHWMTFHQSAGQTLLPYGQSSRGDFQGEAGEYPQLAESFTRSPSNCAGFHLLKTESKQQRPYIGVKLKLAAMKT